MEIVETWYFQKWVNFGGMADNYPIRRRVTISSALE